MKTASIVVLLVLASGASPRVFSAEHYHVWKLALRCDEPIADLDPWVADNFADGPDANAREWNLEKFNLDIDDDGTPEVFVTSLRLHGTGGGPHLVFRKRGALFHYAGQLPGRRHTMRVLPRGPDGLPRVMTFWNHGGGRGAASVWSWDGRGFALLSSEEIRSGDSGTDEGRRRFEELFGAKAIAPDGAAHRALEPPPSA